MTEKMTTHQAQEDARNEDILIYLNGHIVPKAKAVVSVYDSGFMFTDGGSEGLGLYNDRWACLDEHMDRKRMISTLLDTQNVNDIPVTLRMRKPYSALIQKETS